MLERAVGPIQRVDVLDSGVLRGGSADAFRDALVGRALSAPWRHGKWLVAPVSAVRRRHRDGDPSLVFHFGMTGGLAWTDRDGSDTERERHDRLVLAFKGGELRYNDMRKLHGVRLASNDAEVDDLLGNLGPDAVELSSDDFRERLRARRRQLKTALMDQSTIAGLGNLLADEICWRARIQPRRPTDRLSDADCGRLHRSAQTVLRHAIRAARVPDRSGWLTGRRDEPDATCPRCRRRLSKGRVNGRNTVWCPACQPS